MVAINPNTVSKAPKIMSGVEKMLGKGKLWGKGAQAAKGAEKGAQAAKGAGKGKSLLKGAGTLGLSGLGMAGKGVGKLGKGALGAGAMLMGSGAGGTMIKAAAMLAAVKMLTDPKVMKSMNKGLSSVSQSLDHAAENTAPNKNMQNASENTKADFGGSGAKTAGDQAQSKEALHDTNVKQPADNSTKAGLDASKTKQQSSQTSQTRQAGSGDSSRDHYVDQSKQNMSKTIKQNQPQVQQQKQASAQADTGLSR